MAKVPSFVKGIGMSEMDSVPYSGAGSSVVPLGVDCGEDPVAGSQRSASRVSSYQEYLGRGMI